MCCVFVKFLDWPEMSDNIGLQCRYWDDFIEENYDSHWACKCDKLTLPVKKTENKQENKNKTQSENENEINNIFKLWNNYCDIRLNLFENDLKQAINIVTSSKHLFYKYFGFKRNAVGVLPIKNGDFKHIEDYIQLLNELESNNHDDDEDDNDLLLNYLYIYNGIFSIFHGLFERSFENIIHEKKLLQNARLKDLHTFCVEYVLDELIQSGIFGTFCNDKNEDPKKKQQALELCKLILFGNDLTSLNQLIWYCLQDIEKGNKNVKLDYYFVEDDEYSNGIKSFIIARLTFVVFYNLFVNKTDNNNNDKNNNNSDSSIKSNHSNGSATTPATISISTTTTTTTTTKEQEDEKENKNKSDKCKFPKLRKLFEYLWNFSVYNACFVSYSDSNNRKNDEAFHIAQYFKLKDKCFDWSNDSNNGNRNTSVFTVGIDLCDFNYFEESSSDGTLLHCAASYNMAYYCDILLKNGFDCMKSNHFSLNKSITPYSLAKLSNNYQVTLKFDQFLSQNQKQKNGKKNNNEETEAEKEKEHAQVDSAEVKLTYQSFRKQTSFVDYLLIALGCDIKLLLNSNNNNCKVTHKALEEKNSFEDDLFYDLDKFDMLVSNGFDDDDSSSARVNMDNFVMATIKLLQLKLPISTELLILCFEYCQSVGNTDKFVQTLRETIKQCLDPDTQNEVELRNYIWFKEYLLQSNIWLCRKRNGNENENKNKNKNENKVVQNPMDGVLYEMVENTVDKGLLKQKKYIWDNIEKEEKQDQERWNRLLHFNDNNKDSKQSEIRQDLIEGGLKADINLSELYQIGAFIDDSSNVDVFSQYNSKVYLTKLLIFGHEIQDLFQSSMKSYFNFFPNAKYQSANVKTYARSKIKSETDYNQSDWPTAASVVDPIRCSVTYTTVKDLLDGVNQFIKQIETNKMALAMSNNKNKNEKDNANSKDTKAELSCVKDILRIKNGFKNILNWKNKYDCQYVDIKLNLLICNKNGNSIIGEIQFLLSWLLNAKKMGHKLYSVLFLLLLLFLFVLIVAVCLLITYTVYITDCTSK